MISLIIGVIIGIILAIAIQAFDPSTYNNVLKPTICKLIGNESAKSNLNCSSTTEEETEEESEEESDEDGTEA